MLRWPIYAVLLAPALMPACSSNKTADTDTSDTDSIPTDTVIAPQWPDFLPDTAYPSANVVKYQVDTFMAGVSPVIESTCDLYADAPGSFTFRQGMHRQANFKGKVRGTPCEISVDWTFSTSTNPTWGGGTGWTGQPLYVEWPDSCIERFKNAGVVLPAFKKREIMVGSLCGKVYFIDFDSGRPSRPSIDLLNPIKGTMSLDPTLNGNLYVGHGVPDTIPFGAVTIDLYKGKIAHTFPRDAHAWRGWQAYDSSPLRYGQFLFRPGENNTLYKWLVSDGKLQLHSTLRYRVNGAAPGIESSMAIYSNYGYTADNHGNVLCINLNTMRPVWCYQVGDDIDSSVVLDLEDGHPYVYTGCEIDRQGTGEARYIKLDGLDGTLVWQLTVAGAQHIAPDGKHFDGGFYCTALPGTDDCSDIMFANCVLNDNGQNGIFLAFSRKTGQIIYRVRLKSYSWSSPVSMVNDQGQLFVITGDCAGNIYLIRGIDGQILYSAHVGNNFESSPVVVGNQLVVGTRGNQIFKMTVK